MKYTLHDCERHCAWDNSIPPALRIASGEEVTLEMMEASDGQISLNSNVSDVEHLDSSRANPVTGPIYIEDAKPGDALKVTICDLMPSGWGWTANIPGFGLLNDDFPDAALHLWKYDKVLTKPTLFGDFAKIPLNPFIGTLGVTPKETGAHDTIPPRRVGGNLDLRDCRAGAEIIFPVECEGALFSAGDTHAAQGHGEVCGTAIESPLNAVLKFELIKNDAPKTPIVTINKPLDNPLDKKGYYITTGVETDLMTAAKSAVRSMIDLLCKKHQMSAIDAYMLCSVAGDLVIAEIVNQPNVVIAFYVPQAIF